MKKIVRIKNKDDDDSNLNYWESLTGPERMKGLEEMRQEIIRWKYGNQQGFQRVYRIVKRA
jgi:hypothetical protein